MPVSKAKMTELLGMPYGTAASRLVRSILFDTVCRIGENTCFRCGKPITALREFSIEHKDAWIKATDPVAAYFSLTNVAFSHFKCNSGAAGRPYKKHADKASRQRVSDRKRLAYRVKWKKEWRARRRAAGLPYS